MTDEEWKELENIKVDAAGLIINHKRYDELLEKTRLVVEHPEGYDSSCLCELCCSYGD